MEQREVIESQCKDDEWLDSSKGERIALELSAILPSTLDLLYGVWDSTCSAGRNFRMLMSCMMRYLSSCQDPCSPRFMQARVMKPMLLELYELWQQQHKGEEEENSRVSACPKEELRDFIRTKVPIRLFRSLVEDRMSNQTLEKWKGDHGEYVSSVASRTKRLTFVNDNDDLKEEEERALPSIEDECAEPKGKEEEDEDDDDEYGIDGLLEASVRQDVDRVSQHITKLSGGRLFTIRSPGETELEVIRVDVYNAKDIARVDKRNWWRHAKVRSQFLTSARLDRKKLLLRPLMREVAKDLRGLSGVVRDVKTLLYTSHQ